MDPKIVLDAELVAASLAYLSASSFPSMPMCPGTHMRVICLFLCKASFNLFSILVAISPGLNWFLMLLRAPKESLNIMWLGCSSSRVVLIASSIAIASAVYMEQVFGNFNVTFWFLNIIEIPTWSCVLDASV